MTPRQRRFAIFAAVNLALLVAGWMMLISPQRQHATAAAAQEQVVEGQLATLRVQSSQAPTKQPPIPTSDLYALGTALPAQLDEPDLLFELDGLAQASGVEILNVAPQTPVVGATTDYTIQPINLSLSGTYFDLTRYLRSLRKLVSQHHGRLVANGPLFAVTSVSLAPGQGRNELATVGMAAYYYGLVGGATPPAVDTTTTSTTGG